MPRKRCCGLIDEMPVCRNFIPGCKTDKQPIVVLLEEIEAIRLKDRQEMEQAECAAYMGVSRATFQRILYSARRKIAVALVEGCSIIIEGGNYMVKNRVFECTDCGEVWEVAPCTAGGKHGYEIACPKCGSMKKMKLEGGKKHTCGGAQNQDHNKGGCGCGGH
ncbi:MAG: putative DNA-binding protein [Firmicutes bacterium]|nr:putative DNA-binding protein [Bacillota bacterium]